MQRGRRSDIYLCDLSDAVQRNALLDWAWQWQGKVDVWVNNAGADVLTGEAAQWPFDAKLNALWQLDVLATMDLSRLVGERMRQSSGAIINIGWDQAQWGMEGDSGQLFAASKGAVMAFSKSLALSLAPQVRVNCVAPGWIRTGWGQQASARWQRRAVSESLAARWGTPEDVAAAVRFLCSDEASFINGQTLCVNGGFRFAPPEPPVDQPDPSGPGR